MRHLSLLFIPVLLFIGMSTGCASQAGPSEFPSHLMLNYTAKTEGALFPCGCRIPLGGLSRRAGVLNEESPYPQLTLDAGGFAGGNTGYDRFATSYILQAYQEMGYHAVNIGTREASQKVSELREWDQISGGILISANLWDDHGLPVTRTHLIREIGGIKIGITGITSTPYVPVGATELSTILNPTAPLLEVMATFEEENVDFVVLLADAPSPEVGQIIEEVPGIDVVIQGQEFNATGQQVIMPIGESTAGIRIGGTGKYLGRTRIDFDPEGTVTNYEIMLVHLDTTVPTLSAITEIMIEFKFELINRRQEFLGDPANPFQRSQAPELIDILAGYTGQGFCRSCHGGYEMDQQLIGHTRAWNVLSDDSKVSPTCLPCHSTGYGLETGLADAYRDSHLQGVTCEACHGPAADHVRDQTAIKEGLDRSTMLVLPNPTGVEFSREVPEEVCLACHTEDWSPDFDYATWIDRANHSALHQRQMEFDPDTGERVTPVISEELEEGD